MTTASQAERRVPLDRRTWIRFVRAVSNFASSEVRWKARGLFTLLILFLFGINGVNVLNSFVARDFMTAIEHRDRAGFLWEATLYVGVFAIATVAGVLYRFTEERLALLWRDWLTRRLLERYIGRRTYLQLEARNLLANPDQRITDDTRAFTATTLSFTLMTLNAIFTAVAFAGVLWSISKLLFVVAVGYAALGSLMTVTLGRRLVWLNYNQLDKEANLRSELIRVRQHADSVALLHRENRLAKRLLAHLDALTGNVRRITSVNRNLSFFTTGYNYLIQIIPALVIAPFFIRGEIQFGVIIQSGIAFSQLLGAFSLIVNQFQSISSFAAVVARLNSLVDSVDAADASQPSIDIREHDSMLAWERLTLRSPSEGRVLVNDLTASLPRGTRLLVRTEDEASGLALFRATAGIWDDGEGCVVRPPLEAVDFLAERPYLPFGTLRECLVGSATGGAGEEARVRDVLRTLGIENVLERTGGLDVERDWGEVFSLGEQELLAVARVLMDRPTFALLDRVGTALDAERVALVLAALSTNAISYVVFDGEAGDGRDYDAVLEIAGDGTWQWKSLRDSAV